MKARPGRTACRRADVPKHLRPWLFDPRSLTRRLARHCRGGLHVRLVGQCWCVPPADERRLLGLELRERALVREVALCCHGTPWVFARSVFPRASLAAARWRITHLGTRPLGDVLFTTPGMQRVSAVVMPASTGSSLYRSAAASLEAPPAHAWHRDSLFARNGRALLVSELFLDALSRATARS